VLNTDGYHNTYPGEGLQASQDVTQHTEKDHLILKATPQLSQMDELRLQEKASKSNVRK